MWGPFRNVRLDQLHGFARLLECALRIRALVESGAAKESAAERETGGLPFRPCFAFEPLFPGCAAGK